MSFRALPTPTAKPVTTPAPKADRKKKRRTEQQASSQRDCD
ncbi:hypothetical protein [Cryptosporangium sp. NPDC048952]